MTTAEIAVIMGGLAAIAWVNWYFFLAGKSTVKAAVGTGGVQEVRIRVEGGYEPAEVTVRRGVPVRLVFERKESAGCSEEVVIPDFRVRRFLAPFEETVVELTPETAGRYEFTCGMGMLRGRLVVED